MGNMASLTIEDTSNLENSEESKKKMEVKDYHSKLFEVFSALQDCDKELKNLSLEYNENKKKKLHREIVAIEKKLPKLYSNEIAKARKQKRNNNGNNKGGIMKPSKVPKKLRVYLDLKEDDLLPRVKVCKLLNQKLTSDGLRDKDNKKIIKLNKKVGKILGYKKGHEIEFKQFHGWLAEIYRNDEEINKEKSIDV